MNYFKILLAMLVVVSVMVGSKSVTGDTYSVTYNAEAMQLANTLGALKNELGLEYKSECELLAITNSICRYTQLQRSFDQYDVAAILIQESRLNKNAYNKSDGGKGLAQITHKYWYDKFSITNPYDIDTSVKNALLILGELKAKYHHKDLTIARYNGGGKQAQEYVKKVNAIKSKLKANV